MSLKRTIYQALPKPLQPVAKQGFRIVFRRNQISDDELHSEFVNHVFESQQEYKRYANEFEQGPAVSLRDEALGKYQQMTGKDGMSGVTLETAKNYYAVTRKLEPTTVVETGVCNGVSTLSILLAIQKNESGQLYSIDYPFRADESLEEFRQETFENYGGAAIPNDKDPGWIIPTELRSQWELIIGKSQKELPKLITQLDTLDLFVHDSEHSHPCMMFEYELSYEWLADSGMILSDDIAWNDVFDTFTEVRGAKFGKISNNVGYIEK